MKSVNKFCNSIRDASKDESVNSRGNTVYRMFADSERYIIDFADDFKSERWEQFGTDQDASYFGVWINRRDCLTLAYCEGDWTLVLCPDDDHYLAEVRDMIRCYGEGFVAKTLDTDGVWTTFRQDRNQFLTPK